MDKDKKYIVVDVTQAQFWCGTDDWDWVNFTRHIEEVGDKYRFDTLAQANEHIRKEEDLDGCKGMRICDIEVKPISPYYSVRYGCGKALTIKKGIRNEICDKCGVNILVDEPYLVFNDNSRGLCLHCAMSQLSTVDHLYKNVDEKYKKEWAKKGKKGLAERCLDSM